MPAMNKPMAGRGGDTPGQLKRALGAYIRDLRTKRAMTQADLARAVRMTYYTAISAIEVGRNTVPPERYFDFAEALGVNPRTFMVEVLALKDPWAHAMLFDKTPEAAIARINEGMAERFK